MFDSPWQCTVLRQHKPILNNIILELAQAQALGGLVAGSERTILVTPGAEKVPAFVVPVTFYDYSDKKLNAQKLAYVDARSALRKEMRGDQGHVVSNQMQLDLLSRMGDLCQYWAADPSVRSDYLQAGDLPCQVFSAWVSGAISAKLGLPPETVRELQILSCLYFNHQFEEVDEATSERGRERNVRRIVRQLRHPVDMVTAIVNECSYMDSMDSFIENIKRHFSGSVRLAQVNTGFMIMALGNAWFGYGAQTLCAVAAEYPPVFMALVEAAANTKVWKKTHLGRLVERLNTGNVAERFTRSMDILLQTPQRR